MSLTPDERDIVIRRLHERRSAGFLGKRAISDAAAVCGVSVPTIYRWLANEPTRTQSGAYELTERDKLAFFASCGDVANAYKSMQAEGEGAPPSLSTYRRAINREFDEGTKAAARFGDARRRQMRIVLPGKSYRRNERWEADHTQLEIMATTPGRSPKLVRPWLTWVIDAGTRYVGGWAVSVRPTRGEVLAVIRMAVERNDPAGPLHGAPETIVWDNGLEFTANAVTLCAHMLGSYAPPIYPYSPERKPKIERINQSIERELLAKLPFYTRGPRGRDGTLYGPASGYLSLERVVLEIAQWVDHYNAVRPHSGLGGKTPLEAWLADPTPIRTIEKLDLRRFTLERKTATVRHDGGVHADGVAFVAPELHALVRKEVEVGLMPHNFSSAEIFYEDEYVCTARPATQLTAEELDAVLRARTAANRESERLRRKVSRQQRTRFAPMTAESPTPQLLPPHPNVKAPPKSLDDVLGFGEKLGRIKR